jgi:hypothetical protein
LPNKLGWLALHKGNSGWTAYRSKADVKSHPLTSSFFIAFLVACDNAVKAVAYLTMWGLACKLFALGSGGAGTQLPPVHSISKKWSRQQCGDAVAAGRANVAQCIAIQASLQSGLLFS